MQTAVHLSSLPQGALINDLNSLYRINANDTSDSFIDPSIINDIQLNIHLDEKSMKSARINKLNNMADWEIEEIEHEQNYMKKQQEQQDQMHS